MRRTTRTILLSFFAVAFFATAAALEAQAQIHPRGEATLSLGGGTVKVEYGRPPLEGRSLLDMIQPGLLWRMGADQSTTMESDVPLKIGDKEVPAGKHILLARFTEKKKWSLVVSSKSAFEHQDSDTVAQVEGEFLEEKGSAERVTITLEGKGTEGKIILAWGFHRLVATFSATK